jgi:hypothetical protein
MFHRKPHENHTEESIRLSDQAARVAERGQMDDLENMADLDRKLRSRRATTELPKDAPRVMVDAVTLEQERIAYDELATRTGQLLSDGMPPNPIQPPEKPARVYKPGHDPLCVYRHNMACRCADKEPLP